MRLRRIALAGVLGLLGGLGSTGCSQEGTGAGAPTEQVPSNVRVLQLAPQVFDEFLVVTGPVHTRMGADLSSEEAGVVAQIVRDKGEVVQRGQTLLRLERKLLKAELDAASADRELKAYNEDRLRSLLEANSASKQEMLQAHTLLQQAKATEEIARLRYERAAVKAPFAGVVTDRYVDPGQLVQPGTPVVRLVDPFTLLLKGGVTERQVSWLREGAPAVVALDGYPDPVEGVVHWVSFEADASTGKFPVEVRIENRDLRLRAGVVGRARILKGTVDNAVIIPRDALVRRGTDDFVYVHSGGRALARRVKLGEGQGLMVRVESGLASGDELIVRGQREVSDGSRVIVREHAENVDGSIAGDPEEVRQESSSEGAEIPARVETLGEDSP